MAQKQKYRSMEQYRNPRNKPTLKWLLKLRQGGKNIKWKKTLSSMTGGRKLHVKE